MNAPASAPASGLRVSEKVVLGFLAYAKLASFAFPLSLRERLAVVALNLASTAVIVSLARFGEQKRNDFFVNARDWFPCVLILLAYRESGLFFIPDPTHHLDYLFGGWDSKLLHNSRVLAVLSAGSPWLQRYLEFAYFLCYPLVPFGLGSLGAALAGLRAPQRAERRLEDCRPLLDRGCSWRSFAATSCFLSSLPRRRARSFTTRPAP
jgi:hypothetical protein